MREKIFDKNSFAVKAANIGNDLVFGTVVFYVATQQSTVLPDIINDCNIQLYSPRF